MERLLLVVSGLLTSLCLSLAFSFALQHLDCWVLGLLASVGGVGIICVCMRLMLEDRVYGNNPANVFLENLKLIRQTQEAQGRGDHLEKEEVIFGLLVAAVVLQ